MYQIFIWFKIFGREKFSSQNWWRSSCVRLRVWRHVMTYTAPSAVSVWRHQATLWYWNVWASFWFVTRSVLVLSCDIFNLIGFCLHSSLQDWCYLFTGIMERDEIIRVQQQVPLVAPCTEACGDINTADMDWTSTSAAPLPTPSAVPTHPSPGWHGFGSQLSTSSVGLAPTTWLHQRPSSLATSWYGRA